MVRLTLRDNADEFRVEIAGRFAGDVVDDTLYVWKAVLHDGDSRRFAIDITQLTGYDYAGCSLLSDMHKHGVMVVAKSPQSLVFLNEISLPMKKTAAFGRRPAPKTTSENSAWPVSAELVSA